MNEHPRPDHLSAAGAGVLPEAIEREVQEHLRGCGVCARLREDLASGPSLEELRKLAPRAPGAPARGPWDLPAPCWRRPEIRSRRRARPHGSTGARRSFVHMCEALRWRMSCMLCRERGTSGKSP